MLKDDIKKVNSTTRSRTRDRAGTAELKAIANTLAAFEDPTSNGPAPTSGVGFWAQASIRTRGAIRMAVGLTCFISIAILLEMVDGISKTLDELIVKCFVFPLLVVGVSLLVWGVVSVVTNKVWDKLSRGVRFAALILGVPTAIYVVAVLLHLAFNWR